MGRLCTRPLSLCTNWVKGLARDSMSWQIGLLGIASPQVDTETVQNRTFSKQTSQIIPYVKYTSNKSYYFLCANLEVFQLVT